MFVWLMIFKVIFLYGIVVIDGLLLFYLGEGVLVVMGLVVVLGGIVLGIIFVFFYVM